MMAVLYILAMLLLFSASIFVHELGHFLAARKLGMVADVFSIGMGPALWKRKLGATTYQIGWIPFGGFVALPQMDPNSFLEGTRSEGRGQRTEERGPGRANPPGEPGGSGRRSQNSSVGIQNGDPTPSSGGCSSRANLPGEPGGSDSFDPAGSPPRPTTDPDFNPPTSDLRPLTSASASRSLPRIAPWKKIIVSLAGAFGNLVFAFGLAAVVWIVGKPSSLQEQNAIVGYIADDSPAREAGLSVGDEIVAIDGRPVRNWVEIAEITALAPADTRVLRVRTVAGTERELSLQTEAAAHGIRLLPGIAGMDPCLVAGVYPNSGAEAAGLRAGDRLVRFDGQAIYSRAHLSQMVEAAAGRAAPLEYRRDGEARSVLVESRYDEGLQRHLIGIQFNTLGDLDFDTRSHPTPWAQVKSHAGAIFSFLGALATPATSGAAAEAVGGPVLILMMLWLMLKSSFMLAIWFTGFLNVNLAIINLLPLPILDGGHVVLNLWEMVFRRPPPPRFVNALANVFAVLFIALFLLLTFRDSVRHLVPPVRQWLAGEGRDAEAPAVFEQQP